MGWAGMGVVAKKGKETNMTHAFKLVATILEVSVKGLTRCVICRVGGYSGRRA